MAVDGKAPPRILLRSSFNEIRLARIALRLNMWKHASCIARPVRLAPCFLFILRKMAAGVPWNATPAQY
jgi:hypothetical protein